MYSKYFSFCENPFHIVKKGGINNEWVYQEQFNK